MRTLTPMALFGVSSSSKRSRVIRIARVDVVWKLTEGRVDRIGIDGDSI